MTKPALSVLTPTFNRAYVLHRVYDSLNRQAARDFEWVVVDDGSTDDTPALLARWQAEADFPMTWFRYTNNRGKNAAVNSGMELVRSAYTLILDSDDALLDDAMETVARWRAETGIDRLPSACSLLFRCVDKTGDPFGPRRLPRQTLSVSRKEAYYRLGLDCDFCEAAKTGVARQREYVELTASEHCPESVTLNRDSDRYDSVYIDRPILVYYRKDGVARLTDKSSERVKWPRGNYLRWLAVLNEDIGYFRHDPTVFRGAARMIVRLGLHLGRPLRRQVRDLGNRRARLLWALGIPGGIEGYLRDRLRGRTAPKADPDIAAWGPAAPPENPQLHPPPARFRAADARDRHTTRGSGA